MKNYSYSLLRYRHDPTSGEAVNVGVLLYAPGENFAQLEVDKKYGHLANLYRDFCAEDFEWGLESLNNGLRHLQRQLDDLSLFEQAPATASDLAKLILPDNGGSLRFEGINRGRGKDLEAELQDVFNLWIGEQRPETGQWQRRNEKQVWSAYKQILELYKIPEALSQETIKTPSVELTFEHCYRNGKLHALQPLSLQYAKPADIVAHAAQWRGWGAELADVEEFGRLDLLLGTPDKTIPNYSREHDEKLLAAEAMLKRMNVNHRIVREEEAPAYAKELASEMKSHQVLP